MKRYEVRELVDEIEMKRETVKTFETLEEAKKFADNRNYWIVLDFGKVKRYKIIEVEY